MGSLTDLMLQGIVQFPTEASTAWPLTWFPFIGTFVYALIGAMHGNGTIAYGIAIIFFTIILKLMLLPLDFANKFFTKRNQNFMTKIKPEQEALREQYANDPMALNRATQELYKSHGYKMGGFCLFMVINMFVTMMIFFSIFGALRGVATHNEKIQIHAIQTAYHQVYEEFAGDTGNDEFKKALGKAVNDAYAEHSISFLWIKNVWRQDVPWGSHYDYLHYNFMNHSRVTNADIEAHLGVAIEDTTKNQRTRARNQIREAQFKAIYPGIDSSYKRSWNGLLILIILAGTTSWASAYINTKMMQKKKKDEKPKEQKAEYSMRDVKDKAEQKVPTMDPVMMGRIMKIMLPAIMVYFTLMNTSALAIYIIMNSTLSTASMYGLNYPVEKLLAWEEKRKKDKGITPPEVDKSVINPHAKYFKNKRNKQS